MTDEKVDYLSNDEVRVVFKLQDKRIEWIPNKVAPEFVAFHT